MTRAVLLPAGADPFLNSYWLHHYRPWADSIDELHVAVCGPIPEDVIAYTRACIESVGGVMHYFPKRTAHGKVLTYLLEQTKADHVLLVEDDAFIRKPEVVDELFSLIETGEADVVASPRNAYADDSLIAAATRRFGFEPEGLAFWPCFLFTARASLEATDRVFDGTHWKAGDVILGTTLDAPAIADTFIWASYQLRDQGLTISLRGGHRMMQPIPDDAPWFHVGALSSGHGWIWQNPDMTPERYAAEVAQWKGLPPGEAAKRVIWWQRAWDYADDGIPEYRAEYETGLRRFMDDFGVTQAEVDAGRMASDYLVTWAER